MSSQNHKYRKVLWLTLSPPNDFTSDELHSAVEILLQGMSTFTRSHLRVFRYYTMTVEKFGQQKRNPHEHIIVECKSDELETFFEQLAVFDEGRWWFYGPETIHVSIYDYSQLARNIEYCHRHSEVIGRPFKFCPGMTHSCKRSKKRNSECDYFQDFQIEDY